MSTADSILGLFFSDENNLVYDNINFARKMSHEKEKQLKLLPLKFLGPLFLTAAVSEKINWKIDRVKTLRTILDENIAREKGILKINPRINCVDNWGINTEEELNEIKTLLDKSN